MAIEPVELDKPTRTAQTNTKADAVLSMFDQISNDVLASVQAKIDRRVAQKVKKLEEQINSARPVQITINDELIGKPVEGVVHQQFELLCRVVATGTPAMLVGSAGTGKSHAAEMVADSFGLPFYAMSVGAQTSKSDLIGYMDATHTYVRTVFREAYEHGGLFLLDEIDAGNSNVLIQLNAALANGYMSFPDGMVRKHKDFRFIASANTFGLGASRQYVGRNQLDAATLDRFTVITWDIDPQLEEHLAVGHYGKPWLDIVRFVRDYVMEQEIRIVVSPRATQRGALLLESGVDFNNVLHIALLSQFTGEHKEKMHKDCHKLWRQVTADMEKPVKPVESPVVEESSNVTRSYEWTMELAAMSLNNAYKFVFGDVGVDKITDKSLEVANVIVASCDSSAKWELLKLHLPNYDGPQPDNVTESGRQAIYKTLYDTEWDFRYELSAWLKSASPDVVPYALMNK